MLGELVDALGEQRDLDTGVSGVLRTGAELRRDLGLAFLGQGHVRPGRVAVGWPSTPDGCGDAVAPAARLGENRDRQRAAASEPICRRDGDRYGDSPAATAAQAK